MPNLAQLSDYDPMGNYTGGIAPIDQPIIAPSNTSSTVDKVINNLLRDDDKRFQLWPEKVVRDAFTGAHDVGTGETPQWAIDPNSGNVHTSPQMIEKAQAISAAAGTGGLGGITDATLGATPFLRPALKYKDKLYKGKPGQEHQDVIPAHLYPEFQDMAMKGEDISHYNFGFVNDKGHFLNREDALKYGIDTGLIDPQAGKYGALTSTLMADSSKPGTAIEAIAKAEPFYSALEHNVKNIKQEKMTGEAWLGTLANKPGVKPEELDWTGLKGFLEENKGKPVTKEQIEEHLANNKVELKEVNKRTVDENSPEFKNKVEQILADAKEKNIPIMHSRAEDLAYESISQGNVKYKNYQLPGGENYREMLLTLPPTKNTLSQFKVINEHGQVESTWTDKAKADAWAAKNNYQVREDAPITLNGGYKSSHWDEPNILAHVRMNDRTIDGKKALHLEEIQSDWHQQGRDKGYAIPDSKPKNVEVKKATDGSNGYVVEVDGRPMVATATLERATARADELRNTVIKGSGVPDAPFKKTWHELALKRMIREAAEKGYDRLSWTSGEAQAARYDLSKSIDRVQYHNDKQRLVAFDKNGSIKMDESVSPEKVADYVGKDVAEKLFKSPKMLGTIHTLDNADLKIGGEGMKGFYDQIIPKAIEKIGKEHGVKVKQTKIIEHEAYTGQGRNGPETIPKKENTVHYIDIPQSLRDTAMHKGFPLFSSTHIFTPVAGNPFNDK